MKRLHLVATIVAVTLLAACGSTHDSSGGGANGLPAILGGAKPPTTLTTVYEFQGPPIDGGNPFGALLLGSDGNFYGTTNSAGVGQQLRHDDGAVFQVTPGGTERVLYTFRGGTDGAGAEAGVTAGSGGVLYGATDYGDGSVACAGGCGTVFDLIPNGSNYTEHVLYAFQGGSDGANPLGNVLVGSGGNIYGTTALGGGTSCTLGSTVVGCGVVYKLTPSGSGYTEKVLHAFQGGNDGAFPADALIRDSFGRLYGTTQYGGTTGCNVPSNPAGCGIAFMLAPNGQETVLYRFQGGSADGGNPRSALLPLKGFQRLVGTAARGGSTGCSCGTVFELRRGNHGYTETTLYNFGASATDGIRPSDQNGLVADAQGNIFGTTVGGGGAACHCGAIFEISPSPSGYTEKVLDSFKGGDGSFPHASLTQDASGQLYGVTFNAGLRVHGCGSGCGTVFRAAP